MGPEDSWQLIEDHRLAIAGLLEGLTGQEWEQPSLCTRWRVRDVAAHLALGTSSPPVRVMIREGVRARGNFDRLNHDLAVRHATLPTSVITAELGENAGSRDIPAVTNYRNILFDVLVHGQDIAIPLDKTLLFSPTAGSAAAENLWRLRWPSSTQRRFRGLSFRATDTDWSAGTGPVVRGPIGSLLLALAGRPAALPQLAGGGLPELAGRISQTRSQPVHKT
ncbi:MAG TPA: maleylpyruvate isomerase family mycothiol-dependent enzyme [Microlunatus sp.]|nr:maleylpyruvate isomerase family mycothiol-dependent enzyme [Microlunatus sp.]